jgi:hypothetical protein
VRVLAGEEIGARGAALAALSTVADEPTGWTLAGRMFEPAAADRYAAGYDRYLAQIAQARPNWS